MKKRLFSALLSLCLAASLFPIGVLAAEGDAATEKVTVNVTADTTSYTTTVPTKFVVSGAVTLYHYAGR